MLSKSKQKLIHSLQIKKFRDSSGLFVAEGSRLINELKASGACIQFVAATGDWLKNNSIQAEEIVETDLAEIKKVSTLKTPPPVICLVRIPNHTLEISELKKELVLALDDIQDPGNLGTIIRLADWFGISNILCSEATADCYNSKVVQSTMGSIMRVHIHYLDLYGFISMNKKADWPLYGTFLDGKNIYTEKLSPNGLIVLGNEGNGVSGEIRSKVDQRLYIPPFNPTGPHSESLNVSIAAAIVCSEFRRRDFT